MHPCPQRTFKLDQVSKHTRHEENLKPKLHTSWSSPGRLCGAKRSSSFTCSIPACENSASWPRYKQVSELFPECTQHVLLERPRPHTHSCPLCLSWKMNLGNWLPNCDMRESNIFLPIRATCLLAFLEEKQNSWTLINNELCGLCDISLMCSWRSVTATHTPSPE
jgi:hypothetical protein